MPTKPKDKSIFSETQNKAFRVILWVLAILSLAISLIMMYGIPYGSIYFGNRSEADIGMMIAASVVLGVATLMYLTILSQMAAWTNNNRERIEARSSIGEPVNVPYYLLWATPVAVWVAMIPWTFINLGDDLPLLAVLFAVPLILFIGMLFGALAWFLTIVPINLLIRTTYFFITEKEKSTKALLFILSLSLFMLSGAGLAITMPFAIDMPSSSKFSASATMLAIAFGQDLPYRVTNETAFAFGRIFIYTMLASIVTLLVMRYLLRKEFAESATRSISTAEPPKTS